MDDKEGTRVDALEAKNLNIPDRINRDIFREWLKGSGAQPVTRRTLVMALKKIGLSEVASEIERAFGVLTERETPQGMRLCLKTMCGMFNIHTGALSNDIIIHHRHSMPYRTGVFFKAA